MYELRATSSRILAGVIACASLQFPLKAADPAVDEDKVWKLNSLTLNDLLNTEVTSVSRRPEKLFESAAAVHVITNEDIRGSGAQTIPDALRLAPGLFVGQNDANKWAIGSRGFSDRYADKLLVRIDGRSVYTSHFGGVFWENLHYALEDIERIEVIRGPGGSLYGDNAVSGVINIVTKDARDSKGFHATAGGGTLERRFGSIRYGDSIGENGALRGYVNHHARDDFPTGRDAWEHSQAGLRADWRVEQNTFTVSADGYRGDIDEVINVPTLIPGSPVVPTFNSKETLGYNVVARWVRELENGELQVQAYYDYSRQHGLLRQREEKWDLDLQHRFTLGRHDLMYGLGYRYFPARQDYNIGFFNYKPNTTRPQKVSSFLQDEISLFDEQVKLTLGTKLEWWDMAGGTVQPNARLAWRLSPRQMVWTAVSRSELTQSLNDRFVRVFPLIPGFALTGLGNPDGRSTILVAYEAGYRIAPTERLLFDAAFFYFDFDRLSSGRFVSPGTLQNAQTAKARSSGGELTASWQATPQWRLSGAYSVALTRVQDPGRILSRKTPDPDHRLQFRSAFNLARDWDFDVTAGWVDRLADGSVPAYVDLDLRLAWRPQPGWELAVVGQNLISPRRREAPSNQFLPIETTLVPRSVYAQLSLGF